MTENELIISITPCIITGNSWFVFGEIKAYADAQAATKDTEILNLQAEINRLREGIAKEVSILRMLPMQNSTECIADLLLSPAPVTEGRAHGEVSPSRPKERKPITASEAMARLKAENEERHSRSETELLHQLFHQVGNSTWTAKGCAEMTLESNGTWTLERIGKRGKKAIVINTSLWMCLQKAKSILEKLNSPKNQD